MTEYKVTLSGEYIFKTIVSAESEEQAFFQQNKILRKIEKKDISIQKYILQNIVILINYDTCRSI